jgi:hypothetical protein
VIEEGVPMKCLACGAEMSASTKFCEYCGSAAAAAAGGGSPAAIAAAKAVPAAAQPRAEAGKSAATSVWPHPDDLIFRLWNAPAAHPIRWLAFFFPLAWLAGHGAVRAALGLAAIFIAGDLVSRVLTIAYSGAAAFLFAVLVIFYSYKVAVNADRLAPVRGKFHWGMAIGFTLAYVLVIVLLS